MTTNQAQQDESLQENAVPCRGEAYVTLLTGGFDKPYAFGLAMALAAKGIRLDVIGSDEIDMPDLRAHPKIRFLNLQPSLRPEASVWRKLASITAFYIRLLSYLTHCETHIVHILWNNKLLYFDRTVLMLYCKLLKKRLALTAHNVNTAKRDHTDSWLNRLTLRMQYHNADQIFVHTIKMKREIVTDFHVPPQAVQVIPFGINNAVRQSDLSPKKAKERLGIPDSDPTVLFFGRIQPYKGLEYLVRAMNEVNRDRLKAYRLVIAGEPKKEHAEYWRTIEALINSAEFANRVIRHIRYIPDDETEIYFKASDVLALPYTDIYQSGVLFLGYSFGLPVIATDVGSFAEEIVHGETGWLCRAADAMDLAEAIRTHFKSRLYTQLDSQRQYIRSRAYARNSWDVVAAKTCESYGALLKRFDECETRVR